MKVAVYGDSHARLRSAVADWEINSVPAVGPTDNYLAKLLKDNAARFDVVFWSCPNEFHGVRRKDEIISRMVLSPAERPIDYPDLFGPRGRACRGFVHLSNERERAMLLQNYLEMVRHWMQAYPNLILLPLGPYRFSGFLKPGLVKSYPILLAEHGARCVELDSIPQDDQALWDADMIHLSSIGKQRVVELMKRKISDGRPEARQLPDADPQSSEGSAQEDRSAGEGNPA